MQVIVRGDPIRAAGVICIYVTSLTIILILLLLPFLLWYREPPADFEPDYLQALIPFLGLMGLYWTLGLIGGLLHAKKHDVELSEDFIVGFGKDGTREKIALAELDWASVPSPQRYGLWSGFFPRWSNWRDAIGLVLYKSPRIRSREGAAIFLSPIYHNVLQTRELLQALSIARKRLNN